MFHIPTETRPWPLPLKACIQMCQPGKVCSHFGDQHTYHFPCPDRLPKHIPFPFPRQLASKGVKLTRSAPNSATNTRILVHVPHTYRNTSLAPPPQSLHPNVSTWPGLLCEDLKWSRFSECGWVSTLWCAHVVALGLLVLECRAMATIHGLLPDGLFMWHPRGCRKHEDQS